MEHIVDSLLRDFEEGKMNRRQLIRSLAVASGAGAVGSLTPSAMAAGTSLTPVGINHISYRVANYAKTRDFYSGLLGMKVSNDDGTKCRLGVGGISIVAQPGEDERTRRTPLIDHIDYNMDNSQEEIFAALKSHGVVLEHGINHPPSNKAKAGSTSIQVQDPDGFHVTLSPKK
jgi:catechol 2,3-dioxygenase-like lactoylglutathione lyase family enzyme